MGDTKTIMFLGAGDEQCEAITIALELRLRVIAIDGNQDAQGLKIAHVGIHADINNIDEMIKIGKKYSIDGVMIHAVEIPQVVAKIAKALHLPGIDPEVADRATDKFKRLQCFKENNVPCAKFEIAKSIEEAQKKSKEMGFPVVFKPLDRSGSRGVIKVNSIDDVEYSFNHTKGYTKKYCILIEEYLEGKEISTESIIFDKIYTVAFADRNYNKKQFEPFFIEDGGQMPTSLSAGELNEVIQTVNIAIKSLGIDWGVAKGDVIIDNGKVRIIEMAARTSGGRFCSLKVPISTGINMLRPLILMTVGLSPDLKDLEQKFSKGIAERFIFPRPGKIIEIHGVENAKKVKGIYKVHLDNDMRIGTTIPQAKDHTMRKGYVIAIGDSNEEAVKRAEIAINKINIVTI